MSQAARRVRQMAMQHPVAVREDWETPPEFFAALDAEFGFTLDVCATAENAKCARYFCPTAGCSVCLGAGIMSTGSELDECAFCNGLVRDWRRDVCWMNPPYGAEIPKWMAKAYAASMNGATVVCLVPARTDTRWWHEYAERGERRFVKGRIRFVGARYNAPFPCAVVVFRAARPSPGRTEA